MLQNCIEIYDTPKLQYLVCFHAVRRGYIVTVPALEELAVFGTNIKQARIAAATAIEALTEDLEANGVPGAKARPLGREHDREHRGHDPRLIRPARAHGDPRSPALALRRVGLCAEPVRVEIRRPFSRLQLALELVEEAPVGALGDERVRAGLDHARPRGGEARRSAASPRGRTRASWRTAAPSASGARSRSAREPAIDQPLRGLLRLGGADVGSLENGTQNALGGDRMIADEVPVARQQTAEILRPWLVRGRVEDHATDLAGAQFLRLGGKPRNASTLPSANSSMGFGRIGATQLMSFCGIEPDVCRHDRQDTGARPSPGHRCRPSCPSGR